MAIIGTGDIDVNIWVMFDEDDGTIRIEIDAREPGQLFKTVQVVSEETLTKTKVRAVQLREVKS